MTSASRPDWPALPESPYPGTGRELDGRLAECMVLFGDGSWRLCRVRRWQRTVGGWRVLLTWTVTGLEFGEWFEYDEAKVKVER